MSTPTKRFYEFGPFRLDTTERLLLRDGQTLPLTPKAYETLLVLVENCGHVWEKEELIKRLWPETFVEEANLTNNISLLRKALGDSSEEPQYIETVPRRGYRFVARVSCKEEAELTAGAEDVAAETASQDQAVAQAARARASRSLFRHPHSAIRIGIALAAVVLAATGFFYFNRKPALTDKDTVLLADFVNTTGDTVFDDALKQALAVQLEQSPFLNIFPDERVRETLRYLGRSPDERVTKEVAREVCQWHGLKALLIGSIAPLGSHHAITLAAENAQTGDVLAREQVEAESKEQVLKALGRAATQLREKLASL